MLVPVFALNVRHVQSHANLPGVHLIQILGRTAAHRHLRGTGAAGTEAARCRLARTAARKIAAAAAGAAALAGARGSPPDKLADFIPGSGQVVVPVQIRLLLPVTCTLQLHTLGSNGPDSLKGTGKSSNLFLGESGHGAFLSMRI